MISDQFEICLLSYIKETVCSLYFTLKLQYSVLKVCAIVPPRRGLLALADEEPEWVLWRGAICCQLPDSRQQGSPFYSSKWRPHNNQWLVGPICSLAGPMCRLAQHSIGANDNPCLSAESRMKRLSRYLMKPPFLLPFFFFKIVNYNIYSSQLRTTVLDFWILFIHPLGELYHSMQFYLQRYFRKSRPYEPLYIN